MTKQEKFVLSVMEDKNVKANKQLKEIITQKCAARIAKILKSPTSK